MEASGEKLSRAEVVSIEEAAGLSTREGLDVEAVIQRKHLDCEARMRCRATSATTYCRFSDSSIIARTQFS